MKNQNFYMRVISVLLVIMAVLFYNSSMKAKENEKEMAALADKVDTLQEQHRRLHHPYLYPYAHRLACGCKVCQGKCEPKSDLDVACSE